MGELPINKILQGDCLLLLKQLPDNSIDCCVTDPPYGWKFMGKNWDYEIPAVEVWREVLRVVKPGAHILVACGTRTQHRMAVNIEDAGFEIRDVICWHYGQGFPKSLDISKAIDKAAGAARTRGAVKIYPDGTRGHFANNKVYGEVNAGALKYESEPATEEAAQWSGWGTALKPATEFWTLARKPISEKNIAANILKHGTGGLNIDACRVDAPDIEPGKQYTQKRLPTGNNVNNPGTWKRDEDLTETYTGTVKDGRFPANVILDELMAEEMDRQSGELTSGGRKPEHGGKPKTKNTYGKYAHGGLRSFDGDSGGASRFFYVAKPSSAERGGVSHPTVKPQALIQYLIKLICPIEKGKIMLEPFAGSGSHCLAAAKLGIDFVAMELDEHNRKEANDRLRKDNGLFASVD